MASVLRSSLTGGKVIERDQLGSTEFTRKRFATGCLLLARTRHSPTGQASDWSRPKKFIVATRSTGSRVPVSNLEAELLGGQSIYLVRGTLRTWDDHSIVLGARRHRAGRRIVPASGYGTAGDR